MRRFARLTYAFSGKLENHMHSVALYAVWHGFIRSHKSLSATPAMAAGLSEAVLELPDLVRIMDELAPTRGPRGHNRMRNSN